MQRKVFTVQKNNSRVLVRKGFRHKIKSEEKKKIAINLQGKPKEEGYSEWKKKILKEFVIFMLYLSIIVQNKISNCGD